MVAAAEWTIEELTDRVAALLDGTSYAGPPNGRVRDLPDARAVRWYTTIGLVDRPAMRGRIGLYGPRHLLQLLAIKRRQSQGHKIADIQAELANAPDEVLLEIADVPPGVYFRSPLTAIERLANLMPWAVDEPPRRFWVESPAAYVQRTAAHQEHAAEPQRPTVGTQQQPAGPRAQPEPDEMPAAHEPAQGPQRIPETGLITGVPLGGGAVLLLPAAPTAADLPLIRAAAGDLMRLLAARGLVEAAAQGTATAPQGAAAQGTATVPQGAAAQGTATAPQGAAAQGTATVPQGPAAQGIGPQGAALQSTVPHDPTPHDPTPRAGTPHATTRQETTHDETTPQQGRRPGETPEQTTLTVTTSRRTAPQTKARQDDQDNHRKRRHDRPDSHDGHRESQEHRQDRQDRHAARADGPARKTTQKKRGNPA